MTQTERLIVYIVSDSVGETAELVVKAAVSQFNGSNVEIRRIPYVEDKGTIQEVVQIAKKVKALIAFTLVVPEIKNYLLEVAKEANVETVDIIGPVLGKINQLTNEQP